MNYKQKLEDSRWLKKREEILERDGRQCQLFSWHTGILNVHHKYYEAGFEPWEYPNEAMITLCQDCHEKISVAPKQIFCRTHGIKTGLLKSALGIRRLIVSYIESDERGKGIYLSVINGRLDSIEHHLKNND